MACGASDGERALQANPNFRKDLDFTARPGTKTYPRWKDALLGCFKQGRYPHLSKSSRKRHGLNIYCLTMNKMPAKAVALLRLIEEQYEASTDAAPGDKVAEAHDEDREGAVI